MGLEEENNREKLVPLQFTLLQRGWGGTESALGSVIPRMRL